MTDIVSDGEGSELYGVAIPDSYLGLTVDEVSARLRTEHRATLLASSRDHQTYVNPSSDFTLEAGDDALVVAESLGTLAPLRMRKVLGEEPVAADAPAGKLAGQSAS